MANVNRINGASPVGYLSGASWNQQGRTYAIPTSDTTASYAVGDIVRSAGSSDANGIPYVIKIPAAEASAFVPLGIIVGISVADAGVSLVGADLSLSQNYILAGTRTNTRYVYVCDDPQILFEMSGGTTATNLTLAKARYNAGIGSWYSAADQTYAIDQSSYLSTSSPYSNIIIPSGSVATTASLPIQLIGLVQRSDNAAGAYSRLLCRWNYHEFGAIGAVPGTTSNAAGH